MKKQIITILLLIVAQVSFGQKTILWKVTDSVTNKTSTIIGTYHQFGNSFVDSIPQIKQYLYNSELAIFEALDDNEESTKRINNRANSNIKKKLKKKTYLKLVKLSKNWKSDLNKLKPIELKWKLQQEFVKTKCKTVLKSDKWDHFDNYLQFLAKEKEIEIFGFETYKEQLVLISREHNYPSWKKQKKIIRYLVDQLEGETFNKNKCALAEKYRNLNLDYKLNEECKESVLLKERNEKWMKILPKMLSEKNCFVAVGLFHLYNKCGILEQLKNKGFKVEPIEINPAINAHNIQELERKFQFILDSTYQANKDAVGIMIHVESPDKSISWTSAVGFSNKDATEKLNKNQPLLIASNTKTYVSATILKLVENGKLKLNQPIKTLLHKKTKELLHINNYDVNKITVKHLLSHTSGITDYVDDAYFKFVNDNPKHKWTRDEQIELAMKIASPIEAGKTFAYGDINYLLLTEIIECNTGKSFYTAIRELLEFKKHNLNNTWFVNLENKPKNTLSLTHQYSEKQNWDSYNLNPSWDLYGGGGIVSTSKDLALFFQLLFEEKIIKDKAVLKNMYTYVLPKEKSIYCLGIRKINFFRETTAYYHGGWWGTDVMYLPNYNTTISVFTLKKEKRELNAQISNQVIKVLKE